MLFQERLSHLLKSMKTRNNTACNNRSDRSASKHHRNWDDIPQKATFAVRNGSSAAISNTTATKKTANKRTRLDLGRLSARLLSPTNHCEGNDNAQSIGSTVVGVIVSGVGTAEPEARECKWRQPAISYTRGRRDTGEGVRGDTSPAARLLAGVGSQNPQNVVGQPVLHSYPPRRSTKPNAGRRKSIVVTLLEKATALLLHSKVWCDFFSQPQIKRATVRSPSGERLG